MKLHTRIALVSCIAVVAPAAVFAQTAGHTSTTHRARPAAAAKPACPSGQPATPAGLPAATGCASTLYALRYIDLKEGTGEVAPATGFFTVHYTGWLASDGSKFDSSVDRGEPITFPVGQHRVIPGWDTGFTGMKIGGKRRLFIPYQLAYGEAGRPPAIPAKADLIFDVELISASDTPPTPKPVNPPAGTQKDEPAQGNAAKPGDRAAEPAQK